MIGLFIALFIIWTIAGGIFLACLHDDMTSRESSAIKRDRYAKMCLYCGLFGWITLVCVRIGDFFGEYNLTRIKSWLTGDKF